jgi:hypothetical protein
MQHVTRSCVSHTYIPQQNILKPTLIFTILEYHLALYKAVSWLMGLGKAASFQNFRIRTGWLHVRFLESKLALKEGSLPFFSGFPLLILILLLLNTRFSPLSDMCCRHNQAAQYHILSHSQQIFSYNFTIPKLTLSRASHSVTRSLLLLVRSGTRFQHLRRYIHITSFRTTGFLDFAHRHVF